MIDYIKNNKKTSSFIGLVICVQIVLAIIVGTRDISVGHDTYQYTQLYESVKNCHCFDGGVEIGFQYLSLLFAHADFSNEAYFISISLILFFLVNTVAFKYVELFSSSIERYSNDYWFLIYLVVLIFLWSPFYVSAHINAIRQGLSSFFVYLALFAFILKNWRLFVISSIAAISFHHTALMYIAFFPLLLLTLNQVVLIVLVLSVSYSIGFSEVLIAWISKILNLEIYEKISNYQLKVNYENGVRYDFIVFSLLLGLVPYFIHQFISTEKYRNGLALSLKIYLLLLIPFLLFGFANFSNRFVYTAWLFLPFLAAGTLWSIKLWRDWKLYFFYTMNAASPLIFSFLALNGIAR